MEDKTLKLDRFLELASGKVRIKGEEYYKEHRTLEWEQISPTMYKGLVASATARTNQQTSQQGSQQANQTSQLNQSGEHNHNVATDSDNHNAAVDDEGAADGEPVIYHVTINREHPRSSTCDCPYAKGRKVVCKHMIALLFTAEPKIYEDYKRECEEWIYKFLHDPDWQDVRDEYDREVHGRGFGGW